MAASPPGSADVDSLRRSVKRQAEYVFSDASFHLSEAMHALTDGEGGQGWASIHGLLASQPRLARLTRRLADAEERQCRGKHDSNTNNRAGHGQ